MRRCLARSVVCAWLLGLALVAACGRFDFDPIGTPGAPDALPTCIDGDPCEDGDPCTGPDVCRQGTCVGGPVLTTGTCSSTVRTIDRSVGVNGGAALAASAGVVTVTGTTAIFEASVPDNIGIGDVLEYASAGGAAPDALAFVHGRISATAFSVRAADGGTPSATTAPTATWAIHRAYLSLAAAVNTVNRSTAMGGSENPGIAASLRDFDAFVGGKDLVAANERWNVACYADGPDDPLVHINAPWTTDATHSIRIFTPVRPTEVGASQRHNGTELAGYHRTQAIHILERTVWLDGLSITQERTLGDASDPFADFRVYLVITGDQGSDVRISNCFGHMKNTGSNNRVFDIWQSYSPMGTSTTTVEIWNSIGITDGVPGSAAFLANTRAKLVFYSCTGIATAGASGFYNDTTGGSTATVINGLAYSQTGSATYSGNAIPLAISFSAANDATIMDTAVNSTPGASNRPSQTFSFVGAGDYHLAAGAGLNAGVRGTGANLTNDGVLPFSDDIDGNPRPAPPAAWDIGADQTP